MGWPSPHLLGDGLFEENCVLCCSVPTKAWFLRPMLKYSLTLAGISRRKHPPRGILTPLLSA